MELFFLLRPSLTQEARRTIGRRRPSSTFSDAFSASNGPIHSQPPLSYPVRAAADTHHRNKAWPRQRNVLSR